MVAIVSNAHQVRAEPLQDAIDEVFERAVLKVDVTSKRKVFDDKNENICKSEGTAFLIGEHLAVTATHVYSIDPRCGEPIIQLKSKTYHLTIFAEVDAAFEDVTVLKFGDQVPAPMCALPLRHGNVTSVEGMRFGIPGDMEFPSPIPVKIGKPPSDFDPFIELTPTPAYNGESGGPVIYLFSVVGILRHMKYEGHTVMTPVEQLLNLLTNQSIQLDGWRLCNPGELGIFKQQTRSVPPPQTAPSVPPPQPGPPAPPRANDEACLLYPSLCGDTIRTPTKTTDTTSTIEKAAKDTTSTIEKAAKDTTSTIEKAAKDTTSTIEKAAKDILSNGLDKMDPRIISSSSEAEITLWNEYMAQRMR
ncbi:serine protease [Phyllobacterium pellucidum]|uniref:serine protease n=1 Tax=Phyllobacterium pellucidum TaxID=2740464 RepID=UPI001D14AD7D|nr:serine protease [Phyllobacterium sp. T1018]UGY11147.1 serine protease [Phyllobacterium sp. T1018]